jgi:uncharacterized membrane protein
MTATSKSTFWQIAKLGAATGLRTMAAPVSLVTRLSLPALAGTPFALLRKTPLRLGLQLIAGAELIGDKLPAIPARTEPLGLLARAVSGGLSGALIKARRHEPLFGGALLGSITAVTSAFAGYYARRALTHRAELPDPAVAIVEDTLAYGIAHQAVSELL